MFANVEFKAVTNVLLAGLSSTKSTVTGATPAVDPMVQSVLFTTAIATPPCGCDDVFEQENAPVLAGNVTV